MAKNKTTAYIIEGWAFIGRSWSRYDIDAKGNKEHYFAAGPHDASPHHDTLSHYEASCSYCWLGFGHTEEAHAARIAHVYQDVKHSHTGNL